MQYSTLRVLFGAFMNHKIKQVMSNEYIMTNKLSCPNVNGKIVHVSSLKVSTPVLVFLALLPLRCGKAMQRLVGSGGLVTVANGDWYLGVVSVVVERVV